MENVTSRCMRGKFRHGSGSVPFLSRDFGVATPRLRAILEVCVTKCNQLPHCVQMAVLAGELLSD